MEKNKKTMHCLIGGTIRSIIQQANELEVPREDIVNVVTLGAQVYLIYYK